MSKKARDIPSGKSGSGISIVLVLLGLVFLFGDFSLVNFGALFRLLSTFWPLLFIVFGVGMLLRGRRRHFHKAFLYILYGVFLQVLVFGWMSFDIASMWPLFFIVAGLYMIMTARGSRRGGGEERVTENTLNIRLMLDGRDVEVATEHFLGGRCSCHVSSLLLDLSHSRTAAPAMDLDLTAFAGGIVLRVPEDWRVTTHLSTSLSAVHDRRHVDPIEFGEDAPTLHLRGSLTLSRLEVQD